MSGKRVCNCGCKRLVTYQTAINHENDKATQLDKAASANFHKRVGIPYAPPTSSSSSSRPAKRQKHSKHNDAPQVTPSLASSSVPFFDFHDEPADDHMHYQDDATGADVNEANGTADEIAFNDAIAEATRMAASGAYKVTIEDSYSDDEDSQESDESSPSESYDTDEEELLERLAYEPPEMDLEDSDGMSAYDRVGGQFDADINNMGTLSLTFVK